MTELKRYTLTIWIDFVDESPVAAAETADDVAHAVRQAIRPWAVTKVDTELQEADVTTVG